MTRHQRQPRPVVGFRPTAAAVRGRERIAAKNGGKTMPWYKITNSGNTADILIYDEIGYFGVNAQDFMAELQAVNGITQINVHIASPGGDVFDGVAIYNALRRHPAKVTTYVDSIAASAASFIAMAGDQVLIEPSATMMIHDASGLCVGNSADMNEMADLLDRVSSTIATIYAASAGGTVAAWRTAMKAETWYSAEEAVAAGLADAVMDQSEPRNAMAPSFAGALEWQRLTAGLRAGARPDPIAALFKNLQNEK